MVRNNQPLSIRRATVDDLPTLQAIYAHARSFMKANGNPSQWKDNRPKASAIDEDLHLQRMYVMEDENGIHGVFALVSGPDPTYGEIEGAWKNEEPYLVLHRLASDGQVHGLFDQMVAFARTFGMDLRIDTHENNAIMRHLIEKNGFDYCGIILTDDGTPRLAYHSTDTR